MAGSILKCSVKDVSPNHCPGGSWKVRKRDGLFKTTGHPAQVTVTYSWKLPAFRYWALAPTPDALETD